MELKAYLNERKNIVDKALDDILLPSSDIPRRVHEAMRYSVFAGGKRLRPILCIAAAEAVGGDYQQVMPAACALELIHTYSLIHDDLPAMDNDDLRRGRPTNHIVYGEALAILAGDGLLTYAFEILSKFGLEHQDKDKVLEVSLEVAKASGTLGMIGGQVVDMESESKVVDEEILHYIHNHKTGALIKAAVKTGGILGGGNAKQIKHLCNFATDLGLAFQITDDLLDVLGDEEKLGKPVGSDGKNEKATFPTIYGIEKSNIMAQEAVARAISHLDIFQQEAEPLRKLANYLLVRES